MPVHRVQTASAPSRDDQERRLGGEAKNLNGIKTHHFDDPC